MVSDANEELKLIQVGKVKEVYELVGTDQLVFKFTDNNLSVRCKNTVEFLFSASCRHQNENYQQNY